MGYYQAGDYYQGDPGVALVRGGTGLQKTARGFFPGSASGYKTLGKVLKGGLKLLKRKKGARKMIGKGMGRRHRRMNVLNARALRRALRRAKGFEHFARRVITITHPHRGARFKFRRKRRRF